MSRIMDLITYLIYMEALNLLWFVVGIIIGVNLGVLLFSLININNK